MQSLPPSPFLAPKLSFSLTPTLTTTLARRGQLTFSDRNGHRQTKQIACPALIPFARRGAIPHLTRDNVGRLPIEMVNLSLEHFLDIQPPPFLEAPFSLHRFVGLHTSPSNNQQIITMGLRDPSDLGPDLLTLENSVSAATARGVLKVTPANFLKWTLPRPPDILFAPSDDPTGDAVGPKRLRKSVTRSLQWAKEIAQGSKNVTNVFCSLVGGHSIVARREFSHDLLSLCDEAIAGYTVNIRTAYSTSLPAQTSVPALLNASLSSLPIAKPRVAISANGPHELLRLIRDVGIDLFVDDWSSQCATVGVALDFVFPAQQGEDARPKTLPSGRLDLGHNLFLPAFESSFTPLSHSPLALPKGLLNPFGSSPPTRGYVHHLLQSHEMTAHVILALHNQTVMHSFLRAVRTVLDGEADAFSDEVDKFFSTYDEGRPFAGGLEYPCIKQAKEACEKVNVVRGKGSLKEKRKEEAAEEALLLLKESGV